MSRPGTTTTYYSRTDSMGELVSVGDFVAVKPTDSSRLTVGVVTRISGNLSFEVVMDADPQCWSRLRRIAPWYQVVKVPIPGQEIIARIRSNKAMYESKLAEQKAAIAARRAEYQARLAASRNRR